MSRPVLSNLGLVLQIAGMLMVLPILLGFYFEETNSLISYFVTTLIFFSAGFVFNTFSQREEMDLKSSAVLITSVFFILGLIGSIPYLYLDTFPGEPLTKFTNSYFESLSGYTTAGFTMIEDVSELPRSLVFYRSLTQWIGGIGIVFIILAFFYPKGTTAQGLSKALGLSRVIAGIKLVLSHVLILYAIYVVLFVGLVYLVGFTDLLESSALIMSSFATGGLSPITNFAEITNGPIFFFVLVAMILGSLNFFVHDKIMRGKLHGLFKKELIVFGVILVVGAGLFFITSGLDIREAIFHAVAASTTTGFSSHDIYSLNDMSKLVLMALMFIGGMTFSTSGGLKVLRLIMFLKAVPWAINRLLYGAKNHIIYESERIDERDIHVFMMLPGLVLFILFISVVIFAIHGFSISDALFESISSYSLTGFSTGSIDAATPLTLKWWLILLFVIGRVEIIAFLIIFMRRK